MGWLLKVFFSIQNMDEKAVHAVHAARRCLKAMPWLCISPLATRRKIELSDAFSCGWPFSTSCRDCTAQLLPPGVYAYSQSSLLSFGPHTGLSKGPLRRRPNRAIKAAVAVMHYISPISRRSNWDAETGLFSWWYQYVNMLCFREKIVQIADS